MAAVLTVLFLLWITPVKAGAAVRWDGKELRAELGLMIWGARLRGEARLGGGKSEWRLLGRKAALPRRRKPHPSALRFFRSLGRVYASHPWLKQGGRIERAEAEIGLGVKDAAAAALLCGLIRAAGGGSPRARIGACPRPDGKWSGRGLCIIEGRAGMLWLACALAYAACVQKEEKPWSIPSAA